jgi:hypothetical protein
MKETVGLHVDREDITSQRRQQLRHDDGTRAVAAVQRDAKPARANALDIEIGQREYLIDVTTDASGPGTISPTGSRRLGRRHPDRGISSLQRRRVKES